MWNILRKEEVGDGMADGVFSVPSPWGFRSSSKLLLRLKANSEMQNSEKKDKDFSKFNFLLPNSKRGLAHNSPPSILWWMMSLNMMCSSQEFTVSRAATCLSIWQTPTHLWRSFISSVRPAPNIHSLPGSYSLTPLFSCQNTYYFLFICILYIKYYLGFPGGSDSKESAYNAGDPGSVPGLGRSPWRMYYWVLKLFNCFWVCWAFVAAQATLSLWCAGFSFQWLLSLRSTGCSHTGSVLMALRLSCSMTCGIFSD